MPEPGSIVSISGVEQDVRVEKPSPHSSPRVRAMKFVVVTPGSAAPRALSSQVSTGADDRRRWRKFSSQLLHLPR